MDASAPTQQAGKPQDAASFHERLGTALRAIAPKIGPTTLGAFLGLKGQAMLREAGLFASVDRLAGFLAQAAHESGGFTQRVENLNYSAEGINRTWRTRFPTVASAEHLARRPEALANSVYRNRNGNTEPGDGWRYRGRGFIQITGKANYAAIGEALGWPLVAQPELAEEPFGALVTAIAYWRINDLNRFSDRGDFVGLTRAINGGLTGLDDRRGLYGVARGALRG